MVPEGRGLIDMIRDAQPSPNVLHFFCHGALSEGKPYLHIGTAPSRIKAGKAVTLFASDIPTDVLGDRLWLVALNCCRGAQSEDEAASLVFSLMRAGVPAVAGMRRPISDTDANIFSKSFYHSLVRLLAPAAEPGAHVELDWTQTLYDARMALGEEHTKVAPWVEQAIAIREWTLPVLYLTGKPFTLRGRAISAAPSGGGGAVPGRQVLLRMWGAISRRPLPRLAPELTADQRTAAETELQMLRDLVGIKLGAPPEALQAYQERIEQLELQLYGSPKQIRQLELQPYGFG